MIVKICMWDNKEHNPLSKWESVEFSNEMRGDGKFGAVKPFALKSSFSGYWGGHIAIIFPYMPNMIFINNVQVNNGQFVVGQELIVTNLSSS